MLDAPFNHTSYDVELAALGQTFWGNAGSMASSEIRNVEARFFSRSGAYDRRASNAGNIAIAPDRIAEFAFPDTFDVYFGRYASLVSGSTGGPLNEADWFDYSVGSENAAGDGNATFRSDHAEGLALLRGVSAVLADARPATRQTRRRFRSTRRLASMRCVRTLARGCLRRRGNTSSTERAHGSGISSSWRSRSTAVRSPIAAGGTSIF